MKLFAERVVSYGVTMTRTSNCWNDFEELRGEVIDLRQIGMDTVVNLIYAVSPRHSDEYYAQKTREAAAIDPYRICFKDVGGLLTPERARTLIPAIMQNAGKVAVEYHAHCNNGLAPLCYLEAIKHGITSLHTAIPPLANGSSQPSISNMAKNLRALGYTPVVDEKAVKRRHRQTRWLGDRQAVRLRRVAVSSSSAWRRDSNLRHQLKLLGKEDKLPETLEEAARVRADFGYPIMVTPLVTVRRQPAAINVIVGERYKEVTDQVIQYALGIWGKEAPSLIDADAKDKILNRRRAKDWQNWSPPDLSLHQVRQKLGAPSPTKNSCCASTPGPDAVDALMTHGAPKAKLNAKQPLINLIEELTKKKDFGHIYISRDGVSLTLGKSAESSQQT
jgi:oxaloacetate decarboxylase alpha subunit